MSRIAPSKSTHSHDHEGIAASPLGGFATLALRMTTGTNIKERELDAFLSAALLLRIYWKVSPVITSTPFLPNTEIQISLLHITSYIQDVDTNEVLSLSRYCSSREELTPSIVCTAKSDVQDGGLQLQLAVRDATQDWNTSSYTASDMVVGSGRTLYLTTICQHLVCKVQFDITIRWKVSMLVPANEAATNDILLSIPSPTIELEVNGITTSTIITTSSNTSFPSYIDYDVTPIEQDDESRVVEETINIVSRAMYYKPTNDTFISSTIMELMDLPTLQMKKNADTMRIKATPLPLVTTAERVTSTIGSELPIQQSATKMDRLPVPQDSALLAAEIKALDRQVKLEEDPFMSGNSRLKPPPWPNKALFGAYKPLLGTASTHTDTNRFSATPTISPLASPSTSPTTSTPSESLSATKSTMNKHCMTTTRTTSNSAAPRYGRVSSEKSHMTLTPSEVPILPLLLYVPQVVE